MSTIFGVIPVALALSEGEETRAPMAVAVIGGMLTSTILTLVIIPVVYLVMDDLTESFRRRLKRKTGKPSSIGNKPDYRER